MGFLFKDLIVTAIRQVQRVHRTALERPPTLPLRPIRLLPPNQTAQDCHRHRPHFLQGGGKTAPKLIHLNRYAYLIYFRNKHES